jgi:hypothetical protein
MKTILNRIIAGVLTITLIAAGLPLGTAQAAGLNDPPTPSVAAASAPRRTIRLERAFARQSRIVERAGNLYKQADLGFPKIQTRIDKAKENGLDVTQVQVAFDAFKKALADARPIYDKAKAVVDAHKGFDTNGKVTDPVVARETVESLRDVGKEFKDAMDGTYKALKQAIKALRDLRQTLTPTPDN